MISFGLEMHHMLSVQRSIRLSKHELTWWKGPENRADDLDSGWSFASNVIKQNIYCYHDGMSRGLNTAYPKRNSKSTKHWKELEDFFYIHNICLEILLPLTFLFALKEPVQLCNYKMKCSMKSDFPFYAIQWLSDPVYSKVNGH